MNSGIDWETYNPEVFVGRERRAKLDEIDLWALKPPEVSKRVTSVVAPAAMGKTWLLRAAQNRWTPSIAQGVHTAPGRLVIWIDVPGLVLAGNGLNDAAVIKLLKEIQRTAALLCSKVRPVNVRAELNYIIENLVTDLCEHCSLLYDPVVLVDGFDEIDPSARDTVTERILDPFTEKDRMRMIIAQRDEDLPLGSNLRINRRIVSLGAEDLVLDQFDTFSAKHYPGATHLNRTNLQQWMACLPIYQWNHPYINAFLIDRALSRPGIALPRLIERADVDDCCKRLIQHPVRGTKHPQRLPLSPAEFDVLCQIANQLDDTWTEEMLVEHLRIRINDGLMNKLFEYGVVCYAREDSLRYQVSDGLRELLRALNQWERMSTTGGSQP